MRISFKWIIGLLTALSSITLLQACGGGGGSGTTTPVSAPQPVLTAVSVTPANPTIESGSNIQLTATGIFSDNSTEDLTGQASWSSSNTSVATVSNAGLVTASDVGGTTITASYSGLKGSTKLTATGPLLTGLSVTPVNPTVESGSSIQFTATGTYSDNSTEDLTDQVIWNSSNTTVAAVNRTGLVTAFGVGSATITANDNSGLSDFTNIAIEGFTIQGSISVAPGSAADSDVNDPNAAYAPNDTPDQAQAVRNPTVIGGYVNQSGSGKTGRSFSSGDSSDFFRVNLLAGQSAALHLSGADVSDGTDLDLFVYTDDGSVDLDNPDFASVGENTTELITVPADGVYFIEVFATSGAANYTLVIGQTVLSVDSSLRMDEDFIVGEALVKFAGNLTENSNRSATSDTRTTSQSVFKKKGRVQRIAIKRLKPASNASQPPAAMGQAASDQRLDRLYRNHSSLRNKWETLQAIKNLRKRSDVVYAEPNYLRKAHAVPDDMYYDLQWHYPLINLQQAWDTTTGSPGIVVAVIDTGVVLSHPDLQGQLVSGYDFISSTLNSLDGDGIDPDPDDPGDGTNPDGSSSFHGTHVTGTVAASSNNNLGVAGVAWNARVMPLRVLGSLGGTDYDVAQAIRFAAGLANDSETTPATTASVINLSLGSSSFSATLCNAVSEARAAGVIVVASAGNSSTSTPSYPASCDGAVSVSAVDIFKQLATYSNFGNLIDVAAPGGDFGTDVNGDGYPDYVLSTSAVDSGGSIQTVYAFEAGTSMAAPHVAGVIALMEAAAAALGEDLSPDEFDSLLARGDLTEDLGPSGWDTFYGYGLIDANKAVQAAQGSSPAEPALAVTPSALNFGTSTTDGELVVSNVGGGSLTVNAVLIIPAAAQTWLRVSPQAVDSNGLGTYRASVDRSVVPEGTYTATITFVTTAGLQDVPVLMQRFTASTEDDAGFHYIRVIDPNTRTSVASGTVTASNGVYNYSVSDLPFGEYLIYAGSNYDNDADICDAGEACGAFRSLDQPTVLQVGADLTDVNFSTGFETTFGVTGAQLTFTGLSNSNARENPAANAFTLDSNEPQKGVR